MNLPKLNLKKSQYNLKNSLIGIFNNLKVTRILNYLNNNRFFDHKKIIMVVVTFLSLSLITVSTNNYSGIRSASSSVSSLKAEAPKVIIPEYGYSNRIESLSVLIETKESSSLSSIFSQNSSEASSSSAVVITQSSSIVLSSSISSILKVATVESPKVVKTEPKIEKTVELKPESKSELTIKSPKVEKIESEDKVESSSSSELTIEKPKSEITPEPPLEKIPEKPKTNYESIQYWCGVYGCNADRVNKVMICESGGRSNAYGPGGYSGLFQFSTASFYNYSRLSGIPVSDIFNAEQQIQLATWMYSNGYAGSWPNC